MAAVGLHAAILSELMRQGDHEIEIKLRVDDIASARRRLRAIGARGGARVHEANVLFDTANESLRGRGMLLRLRVERPARLGLALRGRGERRALLDAWFFPARGRQRVVVTLKAPPTDSPMPLKGEGKVVRAPQGLYKVRREIEFEVPDARAFREVLTALGLRPAFYYEKLRTTYRLPRVRGVEITLDETPVGPFLELEGSPAGIGRARRALGYRAEAAILMSYGAVYFAYCREHGVSPRDMVFEPRPAGRLSGR
ncbi:MAG TPA: class IV adenylate cyclase [Candidatus Acidoferrales bacterium]|nr:class IV adenylate cyclase [Candidatus Acidoferrales bacterium]